MCSNKIVKSGSGRKRAPVARYLLKAVVHNLRIVDTNACFMSSCYLVPNQSIMADSISIYKDEHSKNVGRRVACWLVAAGHHLSQCWLIVSEARWHLAVGNFTENFLYLSGIMIVGSIDSMRRAQGGGCCWADVIFKRVSLNENICISLSRTY